MKKIIYVICMVCVLSFGCFSLSSEWQLFLKEFIKHPHEIGSVVPSSPYTCRELTHYVCNRDSVTPYHILEVGAGTGVITRQILHNLRPGDVYDIVESDSELAAKLTIMVEKEDYSAKGASLVCVYTCGFEHFRDMHKIEKHSYNVVITTLPFNAFPLTLVQDCLSEIRDSLAPGGHWSYIEYCLLAGIKTTLTWGSSCDCLKLVKKEVQNFCATAIEKKRVFILRNVPPTYVYHLKFSN